MLDLKVYYHQILLKAASLEPPIGIHLVHDDTTEYDMVSLDLPEKNVHPGHLSRVRRWLAAKLLIDRTHRQATAEESKLEKTRSEALVRDEGEREQRRAPITRLLNTVVEERPAPARKSA